MGNNFRVYRANKTNNGMACEFQLVTKEKEKFDNVMIFLSLAKQTESKTENAAFLWDSSLRVKLGSNDIGELLGFLTGSQNALGGSGGRGLFHLSDQGNKIITMNRNDNGIVTLKVSFQSADKKVSDSRMIPLSNADCEILIVLLRQSILKIYGW